MITAEVTKTQLTIWKELYLRQGKSLTPNRISGKQLDDFFRQKYKPSVFSDDTFRMIVFQNAREYGCANPDIALYRIHENVLVGIDRCSGFFHVECEEIEKAIPIWDDLFVKRGLSESDLGNYVITGQYIELTKRDNTEIIQ